MTTVEELIGKHEGKRYSQYADTRGISTIGIGHNMQASPLPSDWTQPLTDAQVDQLFQEDLAIVMTGLQAHLPWALNLDFVRQAVVVDMAFNMGLGTLLTFKHTLGCIQAGDWAGAAQGMLSSLWAKQVGPRATEDAALMTSGNWPTG